MASALFTSSLEYSLAFLPIIACIMALISEPFSPFSLSIAAFIFFKASSGAPIFLAISNRSSGVIPSPIRFIIFFIIPAIESPASFFFTGVISGCFAAAAIIIAIIPLGAFRS